MAALGFSILTAAILDVMNAAIAVGANGSVELSEKNAPDLLAIPGPYDVNIEWWHYLYGVTNLDDVVFKDAKPEYKEYGPFIYKETDTYTDLEWTTLEHPIGSGDNYSAVWCTFNEELSFVKDDTEMMDTTLWQVN